MGRSIYHKDGLLYRAPNLAYGYVLFCSINGQSANLIDTEGNLIHRWSHDAGILYGYILENGNLLCRTMPTDVNLSPGLPGSSGMILELDWESQVVWKHEDPMMHHDFVRLPNNDMVYLAFGELSKTISSQIRGGYRNPDDTDIIYGDIIREIGFNGQMKNEWKMINSLNFKEDVICPLDTRKEWTHANSLTVTAGGNFLISFRNTNTIAIIDRTGEVLWKWGPKNISHQHHATELNNGNILLFDNGSHSYGLDRSRIIQINPYNNAVVWEYVGVPAMSFYSFHLGSAEEQPNGNVFICEGSSGRMFEVTYEKEIVWEYVNPYMVYELKSGDLSNMIFRSHKYTTTYPGIAVNLDKMNDVI
jgi:hypothetical protein